MLTQKESRSKPGKDKRENNEQRKEFRKRNEVLWRSATMNTKIEIQHKPDTDSNRTTSNHAQHHIEKLPARASQTIQMTATMRLVGSSTNNMASRTASEVTEETSKS